MTNVRNIHLSPATWEELVSKGLIPEGAKAYRVPGLTTHHGDGVQYDTMMYPVHSGAYLGGYHVYRTDPALSAPMWNVRPSPANMAGPCFTYGFNRKDIAEAVARELEIAFTRGVALGKKHKPPVKDGHVRVEMTIDQYQRWNMSKEGQAPIDRPDDKSYPITDRWSSNTQMTRNEMARWVEAIRKHHGISDADWQLLGGTDRGVLSRLYEDSLIEDVMTNTPRAGEKPGARLRFVREDTYGERPSASNIWASNGHERDADVYHGMMAPWVRHGVSEAEWSVWAQTRVQNVLSLEGMHDTPWRRQGVSKDNWIAAVRGYWGVSAKTFDSMSGEQRLNMSKKYEEQQRRASMHHWRVPYQAWAAMTPSERASVHPDIASEHKVTDAMNAKVFITYGGRNSGKRLNIHEYMHKYFPGMKSFGDWWAFNTSATLATMYDDYCVASGKGVIAVETAEDRKRRERRERRDQLAKFMGDLADHPVLWKDFRDKYMSLGGMAMPAPAPYTFITMYDDYYRQIGRYRK